MSESEPRIEELEQLLRDERALRIRAETRAADETEKAQIWRTRAEERADRIQRLTDQSRRSKRRKRGGRPPLPTPTVDPREALEDEQERGPSRLASVRVAAAVASTTDLMLTPFAVASDLTATSWLPEADMVVLDTKALETLPTEVQERLEAWSMQTARQPLVVVAAAGTRSDSNLIRRADLVVARDRDHETQLIAKGLNARSMAPVFDPSRHNPMGRAGAEAGDATWEERESIPVLRRMDQVIAVGSSPPADPPAWLIEAAARGVAILSTPAHTTDKDTLARAGAAARRWAFRHHSPTVRAAEIARGAGLSIPDPRPSAAAILVSMRPNQAATALEMIRKQTYRPLSVVVGLHGVAPTPDLAAAIDRVSATMPTTTLSLSGAISLGECLNRAIATTGAEVLVKIDDDDFYGPHHIEDGIQAMEYSGAAIVGKGAQFTYIEEQDRTVLRRPREEEVFLGGSPTGATMLLRRATWESIGFPHRPRQVDVLFTRAARHNGADVYSNSRWEFCYIRQKGGHTWTAPAATFLAGAIPQWEGFDSGAVLAPDLAGDPADS
ncbi:MAG: hypothetical protein QNJ77_13325 [Acidimicrobiia bacterium]|nr:hypothetical protein [Acidimicrobiia bacterium]